MEFIHTQLDKKLLPKTEGRRINGHRFYEIDGKNYPSVTSVLSLRKTEGLTNCKF